MRSSSHQTNLVGVVLLASCCIYVAYHHIHQGVGPSVTHNDHASEPVLKSISEWTDRNAPETFCRRNSYPAPEPTSALAPGLPQALSDSESLPAASTKTAADFTICAVVRDQNDVIREWLHYHHWLGTQQFYIFDHNSSVPLLGAIQDWVDSGVVKHTRFTGYLTPDPKRKYLTSAQGHAYEKCIQQAKEDNVKWMAFIDVDEFLVFQNRGASHDIVEFMKGYEEYGALAVNWRVFGSSGHLEKPCGTTLQAYTQCQPEGSYFNRLVKAIVHIPSTTGIGRCPHVFTYLDGKFPVVQNGTRCDTVFCSPETYEHIALHHYVLKSRGEFESKMTRGGGAGKRRDWGYFNQINEFATENCMKGVQAAERWAPE